MQNFLSNFDPDETVRSILALVFVAVGLLLTFFMGKVSTLSCNRVDEADRCVLRVNWMGLAPLKETQIEGLLGAQVDESCDSDGCTYGVLLVTPREPLPFGSGYSSGKADKTELADKINAFAKDRQIRTLTVRTGEGLWLIIPLIFIAVGVWMVSKPLLHGLRNILSRS
jgi:hypothetical protein